MSDTKPVNHRSQPQAESAIPSGDNVEKITDSLLDRLVDGELDSAQRRQVLQLLEQEPDGWKRCARAFLEAQAFRDALLECAESTQTVSPLSNESVLATAGRERTRRPRAFALLTTTAVCLLAAVFWTGTRYGHSLAMNAIPAQVPNEQQLTQENPQVTPQPDANQTSENVPVKPAAVATLNNAAENHSPHAATQNVAFSSAVREQIDAHVPQPFTAAQLQQLRQHGWKVEQQRQLVAIPLADGRQMVIPVDSLQYQYARPAVY